MRRITFGFLAFFTLISISCSKEDEPDDSITVEIVEQNLHYGDEYQINATSNTPITYSSDNNFHAEVSESGLVTARFVGETNILLSNGTDAKEIPIKVMPENSLYPEPNLDFGISRSALITELGTPDAETETAIGYEGYSAAAPMVMYTFDDNDKMEGLAVLVKTSYSSDLGNFLAERYLAADPDNLIFVNALEETNITMVVGVEFYNQNHWMVGYTPYSSTNKNMGLKSKKLSVEVNRLSTNLKAL